ncbi:hypothetical protein [Candidatus Neptunichlamydia sp. REUL1]|uniref:hypothetical protein n=1 Tax=Candidatus Neptunichlamydia sp. REUL1 TaxID=3064277 RepID=UPI00292CCACA|nr:hypothetical protein [Candidatus Neptunochlamydia sp. REUL1]
MMRVAPAAMRVAQQTSVNLSRQSRKCSSEQIRILEEKVETLLKSNLEVKSQRDSDFYKFGFTCLSIVGGAAFGANYTHGRIDDTRDQLKDKIKDSEDHLEKRIDLMEKHILDKIDIAGRVAVLEKR